MYKNFVNALYVLNIVFQSFFNLFLPMMLMFGAGWLLVRFLSAPGWIYAPLIAFGALAGLYSMVKFILTATAGLQRLEKQQAEEKGTNGEKNERQ